MREGNLLSEAFTINPDYLSDYKSNVVDFSDLGLQLTRSARALKIWLSFNYFGLNASRQAVDRTLDLALAAEALVRDSETLELITPASIGIICFRRNFDGVEDEREVERLNGALVVAFEATAADSSRLLDCTVSMRFDSV